MANYGDFSSLLQLGVGIGIGLSLFRAPADLRVARISRSIEAELIALRGVTTPFAKTKRRDMQDLRLQFIIARGILNRRLLPFMAAAIIAALLNLAALIVATLHAGQAASACEVKLVLFITVGWFLIELAALEVLAQLTLSSVARDLDRIRARKAPPVQVPTPTAPPPEPLLPVTGKP